MTDQNPYAGYDKGKLYGILERAGGLPNNVPDPEAFAAAWKMAPDAQERIEVDETTGKKYKVGPDGVGIEVMPEEGTVEYAAQEIQSHLEHIERETLRQLSSKDHRGVTRLKYADIASYIIHKYACVAFNGSIYIYDPEQGIFKEDMSEIGHEVKKIAIANGYEGALKSAIGEIKEYIINDGPPHREWPFNRVDGIIPVKNGVVKIDFTTGIITLAPHSPDYRLTWTLPITYDPEADGDWFHENVVKPYVDSDENLDILYQIPAQALLQMQSGSEKPYKKSYILKGDAHAGKTTYLEILWNVFGKENCSNVSLQQIGSYEYCNANMENALLNVADDLSDIPLKNVAPFKALTGGFWHRIEEKFKPAYNGRISAVHIFTCNATPAVDDKVIYDAAFWTRWEYIHFYNVFEIDPEFNQRVFTDENLSGFFNRVLKYAILIRQGGLVVNRDPGEVKKEWQLASDPFKKFIAAEMVATVDEHPFDKETLLHVFREYCHDTGVSERRIPRTLTSFTTMIFKDGFRSTRGKVNDKRTVVYKAHFKFKPDSKYVEIVDRAGQGSILTWEEDD